MAPFTAPKPVVSGFKDRVESLTVQGDTLYVGTATGNLHIYDLNSAGPEESTPGQPHVAEVKKSLSRRALEQLAYISDVSSLAVLSDALVTLYPVPSFTPPTPLPKTKSALSFALFTEIQRDEADEAASSADSKAPKAGVPVVATYLAVGCRRKFVLYSWRDGEPQDVVETTLPHSPRATVFLNSDTLCFGYSPTDYVLFSLKSRTVTEVITPVHAATSSSSLGGMGMGAFSGLGGYIGLGAKAKPCALRIDEKEGFIAKENSGIFIGEDGKSSRGSTIDWPAPPDDIAFAKPYIFTILPPGTVPIAQLEGNSQATNTSFASSSVLEIRSSISLAPSQTIPLPFADTSNAAATATAPAAASSHVARLVTPSASTKSPVYIVTTPTDRAAATASGSTIWSFSMKPWGEQIDEMIDAAAYADALALLESIDPVLLPDKDSRIRVVRALHAVSQFRSSQYADAMNAFLDLNINPAKVVALYPESISGRLAVSEEDWIPLFGGPTKLTSSDSGSVEEQASQHAETESIKQEPAQPARPPSPQGSVRGYLRTGLDSLRSSAKKEEELETAAVRAKRKEFEFRKSIEELMRYLSDRRPKVAGALEVLHITTAQAHEMPFLSATSKDDLFTLPDAPLPSLSPEELVRFAQIVDTALFKCYLLVRPGLLAPLCRVGNWCEVSEVEEVLMAREKFNELIYLYNGKKMHGKALDLLRRLSDKETDMRDKLMPSVNYLQRLGPEHLDLIFEHSRWVFEQDTDIAFEIFTSEEVELPRQSVADFLETLDPAICARFVEHLINERGEESPAFHNRLAELYLNMTLGAKKRGDGDARRAAKEKLLHFIDTTNYYETDRLFGLLPADDLFEAKAILLGRLGRHDNALEIYVYRLQDFMKAEEYCKRIYQPDGPTKGIFLTLLRIYLRPTTKTNVDLLAPALDLITRHSPRLDEVETLNLLPPLVPAQDVRAFLIEALRQPIFDRRVIKDISKARDDHVARQLMWLQSKRVKVTDSRICPQCHKRIGHSVIAVHAPRGEVTHYQCREAFSRKLKELRP